MTMQLRASHLQSLEVSMTALLLSAYVAASIAVVTALGGSSSAVLAGPRGSNTATIELEAPALFAQGLEP